MTRLLGVLLLAALTWAVASGAAHKTSRTGTAATRPSATREGVGRPGKTGPAGPTSFRPKMELLAFTNHDGREIVVNPTQVLYVEPLVETSNGPK